MDKRAQRWGKWTLECGFLTRTTAQWYADQMDAPHDSQATVRMHGGDTVVYVRRVL